MGEYYQVNGRTYYRATRGKQSESPTRQAIREVNRVRKCFEGNTELHHKLQLLKQEPVAKHWQDEDEICAGNDDQRFTRRSERE